MRIFGQEQVQQMDGRADQQESAGASEIMRVQEKSGSASEHVDMDSCPVCHLKFHSREPRLLPCLHSFCHRCLPSPSRVLAITALQNSDTKPLNVIRCPVCRQECMETDVVENVFVKDSAEAPSSTAAERTLQLCMTCEDNTESAGFCVDCVEYLCATCVEAHQRVKFTKDHNIRHKTEVSQEVHVMSTQRPVFCDIHKQEPLKLFCETCDQLTCRDCQLVKHKDHNYQFLEDAYKNHRQHMERATLQLQEKKKLIEDVSNSINNGLLRVDQNRTSVHDEIQKSICSLIVEINKKGNMLINQLEAVTKDHESVLRKQQEDVGYLSRHLDHVIKFTKWATAKNGGTGFLYTKRLILFQIENLLRAKCSTSFIPQSTVHFQCRSLYWASNIDLGSLVIESIPGHQLVGFQGIPHQLSHHGHAPSGSPRSFALGAPVNTLAQLQLQVDKLNPQALWQPQAPPSPWSWYQSVRLQRTVPGPLQGGSPSHIGPPQPGRRFTAPPPNHTSPTSSAPSPGFTPRPLRTVVSSSRYQDNPVDVASSSPLYSQVTPLPVIGGVSSSQSGQTIEPTYLNKSDMLQPNCPQSLPPSLTHRNVRGRQTSPEYFQVEKSWTVSWKPPETQQASGVTGSAVKKRRRSSPGPAIVIKDEPEDDSNYVQNKQRASLPDSTGEQHPQVSAQGPPQSSDDKLQSLSKPPSGPWDQRRAREQQVDLKKAQAEDSNEVLCAVCQSGGDLVCCGRCLRVFHPVCHVPSLLKSPSGKWFCSFCRDPSTPEMEYDCDSRPETKTVKQEFDSEGEFPTEDRRKCERLLLHLLCNHQSSNLRETGPPSACANNSPTINGQMSLLTVRRRLDAKHSLYYQSTAEFVSDIRLIFRNGGVLNEANTEDTTAGRKLMEFFEERLMMLFSDQSFPEIKLEIKPADHSDSQVSSPDKMSQRTCSYSQDTPNGFNGDEAVV
ncbi:transcription intermediary factor 1-alpha-like [Solea solea]|uniref:transcription intermediary factor 1-alpha-like n=1 Tax=Solea solea TaxID=90069 RepID=UPI00272A39C0|nr:transcription intermediary factor 1-alpha-like [Solea solea]